MIGTTTSNYIGASTLNAFRTLPLEPMTLTLTHLTPNRGCLPTTLLLQKILRTKVTVPPLPNPPTTSTTSTSDLVEVHDD